MILTLPPRLNGEALSVDTSDNRQIIIIGANGSGKTRFANRLMADLGPKAFKMSAIKAIYGKDEESREPGRLTRSTASRPTARPESSAPTSRASSSGFSR